MNKEIIDLITNKIKKCNDMCMCNSYHKNKELLKDQQRCGNCHSKDILIELLGEVNDLELGIK